VRIGEDVLNVHPGICDALIPVPDVLFQDQRPLVASAFSGTFLQSVDRRDVGMIQRREHVGLALEPGESVIVVDEGVGEDLQGNIAAELCVRSPIHPAHTAFAEESDDLVVSEPVTDVHRHALEF